jgi:hypothetical protein
VNDLGALLADAYRPYVLRLCEDRGWRRTDRLLESLAAGEHWLRETLSSLLDLPFGRQPRGPLEVFQEAMRFPTDALAADGVQPPSRDEAAARALPGDVYDLAPASPRLLGDDVWAAHMAWGARKAATITRVVLVATRNLVDWSRIEGAAEAASLTASKWHGSSKGAALVCVDLEFEGALAIIEAAAATNVPVVAYGPHRSTDLLEAARNAGATALARSAFFSRLDVESWVGSSG